MDEFVGGMTSSGESSSSRKRQPIVFLKQEHLTVADLLQGPWIQILEATFHANGNPAFLHPLEYFYSNIFDPLSDERGWR